MSAPRRALEPPLGVRVAYGVSDLGASLTFVAVNTWLLYVLVNVAGVPPLWAGAVFVVGRVVDAVTDPLMGVLADRWRDRVGRLPFLRWGALPLAATFAAVWWAPDLGPVAAVVYATASFVAFGIAYTVVQVPTMALTPELAQDYDGRTALTSWRIGFGVVASMLAVAAPPLRRPRRRRRRRPRGRRARGLARDGGGLRARRPSGLPDDRVSRARAGAPSPASDAGAPAGRTVGSTPSVPPGSPRSGASSWS